MKYLSHYTEQAQTDLFKELGAFFAFGQKQFDEQKKEGVKYVSMGGMGLLCPKENADQLFERLNKIHEEGIKQDLAENGKEGVIKRELENHECYYTGNVDDCVDVLESYGISREEILNVYRQERKRQQEEPESCDHSASMAGPTGIYCPTCEQTLTPSHHANHN